MNKNRITALDAIKPLVITSLVPMMDRYPILKNLINSSKRENPIENWDFYMTTACAGVILFSSEDYKDEHKAVEASLNKLDKNYMMAVKDFKQFIKKSSEDIEELKATIGYWVLWNVKKDRPSDEELQQLALTIGNYIIKVVQQVRQEKIGQ